MKGAYLIQVGRILTLITLFLLPWQTRYIFWRPWVGTTESEFGVISLYVTMLLTGAAALCFFAYDFLAFVRSARSRFAPIAGMGALLGLAGVAWTHTYPTTVHAWTLHVLFAFFLGYITYRVATQHKREPLLALSAGFIAPILLGIWQMLTGFSPDSTLFGLAARHTERLGDAVLTFGDARILRMYGSFPHPNIFGAALAVTVTGVLRAYTPQLKELLQKIFVRTGVIGGALLVFIVICISRSAGLALVCAGLAWYGKEHAKKAFVVLAFLLPVLVWTAQFAAPELLALRGNAPTEIQSINERVIQVRDWWRIMAEGGILGVGIYAYPEALTNLDSATRASWAYQPVHNIFLLISAEIGVFWTAFVLLLAGRGAWMNKKKLSPFVSLFACLWSLAWFDHVLWTSWAGMAYTAAIFAVSFEQKTFSTRNS